MHVRLFPLVLLVPFLAVAPRLATACQDPPTIPCDLVPATPVVEAGQPFDVIFSMTNLGPVGSGAMDDLDFQIEIFVGPSFPGTDSCRGFGTQPPAACDPPVPMVVQLDDAWSPAADEPTSFTQVFRITPGFDAEAYSIMVRVTSPTGARGCVSFACVQAVAPSDPVFPWAEFVDPVRTGPGGSTLPFDLVVHRNGYDPTHPLRVVVQPHNDSDPVDLFPMTPADLADFSRGVLVTQEDETVHFECHCHFPCYVGASNVYDVTLVDSVTGAWLWWKQYQAKALVDRSPLALAELVEIVDASGNGGLESCEPGQVHLRLIGRHPFAHVPMDNMRLELPLPAGVSVASWSLHFHDNPMDAVMPTPAELEATGVVTVGASSFVATTPRVAWRYEEVQSHPPVFKDMFEAELLLDVSPGATEALSSLDFAGFTVSGVVAGIPRSETAPTVSVPLGIGAATPGEVSPPGLAPLLLQPDKQTLSWDPSGSSLFNVYRGAIANLPGAGDCVAARVTVATFTDLDPLPPGGQLFYLVAATRCGVQGPLGTDSRGDVRVEATTCP